MEAIFKLLPSVCIVYVLTNTSESMDTLTGGERFEESEISPNYLMSEKKFLSLDLRSSSNSARTLCTLAMACRLELCSNTLINRRKKVRNHIKNL